MRDWAHPTPEMVDAVRLGRQCSHRRGLSDVELGEWVMSARESLWYFQAAVWADVAPPEIDPGGDGYFRTGAALVVRIVDLGYDEQERRWWNVRKIWPDTNDMLMGIMPLMDFGDPLLRLRSVDTRDFEIFLSIVCGPRWQQRYKSMAYALAEGRRLRRR